MAIRHRPPHLAFRTLSTEYIGLSTLSFPSKYTVLFQFVSPKVAGAAAAAGLSLAEVFAEAEHASKLVGTMGVALPVCTLPGQVTSYRLGPGKMDLGLGISKFHIMMIANANFLQHGEAGAALADIQPVDVVVSHVLNQILSSVCCNFVWKAFGWCIL